MNQITVIIPTFNEELHIRRCILSMKRISSNIYILDSFSNDSTKEIALSLGANVLEVKWENSYAKKFNWGLDNIKIETPWVMRMDADEYLNVRPNSVWRSSLEGDVGNAILCSFYSY